MRVASDVVPELIELYRALQSGWEPPRQLTRDEYYAIKADPTPTSLRGFAAFGCSFAGKYFGGYAGQDKRTTVSYATNAANSLGIKRAGLQDVVFHCASYDLFNPVGCLIYCDPPYANTTGYSGAGRFDTDKFWSVVRKWSDAGNTVLISEYTAPDWAVVAWEKPVKTEIRGNAGRLPRIERLYMVDGGVPCR